MQGFILHGLSCLWHRLELLWFHLGLDNSLEDKYLHCIQNILGQKWSLVVTRDSTTTMLRFGPEFKAPLLQDSLWCSLELDSYPFQNSSLLSAPKQNYECRSLESREKYLIMGGKKHLLQEYVYDFVNGNVPQQENAFAYSEMFFVQFKYSFRRKKRHRCTCFRGSWNKNLPTCSNSEDCLIPTSSKMLNLLFHLKKILKVKIVKSINFYFSQFLFFPLSVYFLSL